MHQKACKFGLVAASKRERKAARYEGKRQENDSVRPQDASRRRDGPGLKRSAATKRKERQDGLALFYLKTA